MLLTMSRHAHTAADRLSALRELGFDKRESNTEHRMKDNVILVVASLLAILLLTLRITDDIVRGISKAEPSNTALLVSRFSSTGRSYSVNRPSGVKPFGTAQVDAGVLVFWLLPSFCSALCLLTAPGEKRGIA
jgi:hypothetical protein